MTLPKPPSARPPFTSDTGPAPAPLSFPLSPRLSRPRSSFAPTTPWLPTALPPSFHSHLCGPVSTQQLEDAPKSTSLCLHLNPSESPGCSWDELTTAYCNPQGTSGSSPHPPASFRAPLSAAGPPSTVPVTGPLRMLFCQPAMDSSLPHFLLIFQTSAQEASLAPHTGQIHHPRPSPSMYLASVTFTAMCNFILFSFATSRVAEWLRRSTLEPDSVQILISLRLSVLIYKMEYK